MRIFNLFMMTFAITLLGSSHSNADETNTRDKNLNKRSDIKWELSDDGNVDTKSEKYKKKLKLKNDPEDYIQYDEFGYLDLEGLMKTVGKSTNSVQDNQKTEPTEETQNGAEVIE